MENQKRVVLMTGCTGPLGRFFAQTYSDFYTVVGIARRSHSPLPAVIDYHAVDIRTDPEQIVRYVLEKYRRLDVLINAARADCPWSRIDEKSSQEFREELEVNVVAPMALSNAIMHAFWRGRSTEENIRWNRNVVNVSSIAAINMYEGLGQGTYAASKAALNVLTKHMASEYKDYGIRVNAIAPNTFPHYVSLERVCAAIVGYIEGNQSGEIKIMDRDREYIV